jgi:N-acetylglucosamine-6-phosphate deacetylase
LTDAEPPSIYIGRGRRRSGGDQNPRPVIGADGKVGSIAAGKVADLFRLHSDWSLHADYSAGIKVTRA